MKKNILYILLLCLTFVAAYFFIFDEKLDTNGDNACYIELAHSLASDRGYSQMSLHGDYAPANQFPPGYPFILSLLLRAGIDNLIIFKLFNGLFLLASIVLIFFIFKNITGSGLFSFATALISMLSYKMLEFSTIVMSEMSYMLVWVLALFAMWRLSRKKTSRFDVWFWVATLSAVAAYYIRGTGLAIIFSLIVFFIFRKEWIKAAVSSATCLALMLPWSIRARLLGFKSRYMDLMLANNAWRPEEGSINSVSEFLSKTKANLDDCILRGFREVIFPGWESASDDPVLLWEILVGLAILAIIIYGLWNIKPLRYALTAFLAANIVIIITWHTGNHLRYVTPFIPIIIIGFWYGTVSLVTIPFRVSRHQNVVRRVTHSVILLFFIPSILTLAHLSLINKQDYTTDFKEYIECSQWIQDRDFDPQIAKELTIICRKPSLSHYYAKDYYCTTYLFSQDIVDVIQDFVDVNAYFIIVDALDFYSSTDNYLVPAIEQLAHLFTEVHTCGSTRVLKFDKARAEVNLGFIKEIRASSSTSE